LASVAGGVLFTPWAYLMYTHLDTAVATSRYLSESLGVEFTLREWGLNIGRLLVAGPQSYDTWLALLSIGVMAMMLAASVALWRKTTQATWLFLLLILLLSIAPFVIPDVLFGGQRSVRERYFMPAYMAATLILAFWLAEIARQRSGQIVLVALLLCALFSSLYSVQAATWWESAPIDADVATLINQGQNALIISDTVFGVMAMLADDLDQDVSILLVKEPTKIRVPDIRGPVFVYQPSAALFAHIQRWPGLSLKLIYQHDRWDMTTYYLYELHR